MVKALENRFSGCFSNKGNGRKCPFKSTCNPNILYDYLVVVVVVVGGLNNKC